MDDRLFIKLGQAQEMATKHAGIFGGYDSGVQRALAFHPELSNEDRQEILTDPTRKSYVAGKTVVPIVAGGLAGAAGGAAIGGPVGAGIGLFGGSLLSGYAASHSIGERVARQDIDDLRDRNIYQKIMAR